MPRRRPSFFPVSMVGVGWRNLFRPTVFLNYSLIRCSVVVRFFNAFLCKHRLPDCPRLMFLLRLMGWMFHVNPGPFIWLNEIFGIVGRNQLRRRGPSFFPVSMVGVGCSAVGLKRNLDVLHSISLQSIRHAHVIAKRCSASTVGTHDRSIKIRR